MGVFFIRTYADIFKSYLDWLVEQTGDNQFNYDNFMSANDEKIAKSFLFKSILEMCYNKKNGIYYFCKFIIGDLTDIGYPNPFRYNSLLRSWDKLVRQADRIAILSARGHGKSVYFDQILNIYDMFLYKYKKIIIISSSQEQANSRLEELKTIIDNNEWLRTKRTPNKWATETIGYNRGYILVKGIESEVLGQHVDRIILDDILRSDNKISDVQIEDYIDMTLEPMLMNRKGQMIIVGCVNEHTKVLTEKGFCEIKQLNIEKKKLKTFNKNIYGVNGFNNAEHIFYNGKNKTKKITTDFGYELESTLNHPILINNNGKLQWKKTENLKEGDYAVIQYGQHIFGDNDCLPDIIMKKKHKKIKFNKITKDFAYLMGLYTAEGSNYKEDSICITNTEVSDFLLGNNDMGIVFKNRKNDKIHYSYNSRLLVRMMKELGVSFTKCNHKNIPNLYDWKKELIVEFLKGYGDGDGCVTGNTIKYTSTSKRLLTDIQVLLLNFGILSSLTEFNYKKQYKTGYAHNNIRYDLSIISAFNSRFFNEIGFRLKRKNKDLKDGNIKYPYMYAALRKKLKEVKKKTNIKNVSHLYSKKNAIMTSKKLFGYIKDFIKEGVDVSDLLSLINKYVFLRIKNINNSESETYDFVIPNTKSFLSNGFISHNTPKRESDIFTTIFNRKKQNPNYPWIIKRYPAILDHEKKIILCPDRFTWDEIIRKRLSMGALKFAREYQLEFFSRDTSLFQRHLLDPAKKKGAELVILNKIDKRPPQWIFTAGVDVARSGKVSADYSVVVILAYNSITQEKQIAHFWRSKGLKISEQSSQIAEISRRFDNPVFLVEKNNLGQDMIDELVDKHNLFIEEFITGGKGQKKDELIRFLITAFEHEQIVIPRGDDRSRELMDILESELTKFCVTTTPAGNERFEGVGSHDDTVIAFALANKATQTSGIPFAVTNFDGGNTYSSFVKRGSKHESELVAKIRMGLIK